MGPIFTLQYAEYLVAEYLAKKLSASVFVPSSAQEKGIDLLLYRYDETKGNTTTTIQIKMSRTYFGNKKNLPGYDNHLWFNRFQIMDNAGWFILVGIYPILAGKGSVKDYRWENIMLAFTNSEMKKFMSEVKQKKNPQMDDKMFGFSFDNSKSIFQTRGYPTYRDMSSKLIENRMAEIDSSFN